MYDTGRDHYSERFVEINYKCCRASALSRGCTFHRTLLKLMVELRIPESEMAWGAPLLINSLRPGTRGCHHTIIHCDGGLRNYLGKVVSVESALVHPKCMGSVKM